MNSFLIAITVVCPLLIYMMVGAGIQKLGIMSKENFKALNTMIFKIFIPLGVFFDIYETNQFTEKIKSLFFKNKSA